MLHIGQFTAWSPEVVNKSHSLALLKMRSHHRIVLERLRVEVKQSSLLLCKARTVHE